MKFQIILNCKTIKHAGKVRRVLLFVIIFSLDCWSPVNEKPAVCDWLAWYIGRLPPSDFAVLYICPVACLDPLLALGVENYDVSSVTDVGECRRDNDCVSALRTVWRRSTATVSTSRLASNLPAFHGFHPFLLVSHSP